MADLTTALPALLQGYDVKLRDEAERLAEDGAVVTVDMDDAALEAEVVLDTTPVHVRWSLADGHWSAETDVEDKELHDLAACMALVGLKRISASDQKDEAAVSMPVESLQTMLERLHARKLSPEEEGYLQKIEKRFERLKKTGEIFDHDLVRLHPKWSIQSAEALELWEVMPQTTYEFWNYVALALHEKSLPFPMFLRAVTDLESTRAKLRSWRQSRTVPHWVQRIRQFAIAEETEPSDDHLEDCRLMITVNEAKLQLRERDFHRYHTLMSSDVERIMTLYQSGCHSLETSAELLLVSCFLQMRRHQSDSFRLDDEVHAGWLGSLFLQPALRSRLVNLDAEPFIHDEQSLKWEARESGDESTVHMKLVRQNGEAAPTPMRVLPGAQTRYLSGDTVFSGPLWFGEETLVDSAVEIPMAALGTSDGIAFLNRLEVPLPKSLADRIRHESLTVSIKAECAHSGASASTQYAHFTVTASSPGGNYEERLRDDRWVIESDPKRHDRAIICRDRGALKEVPALLRNLRASFEEESGSFRVRMTRNFPENFYDWAQHLPEEVKFEPDASLSSILADPLIARVRLEASQSDNIDWFDLKLVFDIEGADLKAADIRRLLAANGGFVRLADGTWRRVKIELSEDQQEMVEQLGIDLNDINDETHRVHWRHLLGDKGAQLLNAQAWAKLQMKLADVQLNEKPEVPSDLKLTLRPYQVDGYHFLSYLTVNGFGGILADDMGLGKTVQTISWILWLRANDPERLPVLVVCPKSVLDVWAVEMTKASPDVRVQVLHDKDELDISRVGLDVDVLVLNYAQLRSCIHDLARIIWRAAILDEGQQIKNPDSKAAKAARELQAHNRLVLTGTPLENRLLDLWSLMSFATPGALGDRSYFHKHFDRRKDERASERLSARLRPFILRRTKGQVAKELPARTEENMLCEMSGVQEQMYKDELSRAQHMMLSTSGVEVLKKRRFAMLQALTRLRQVCCHPGLINPEARNEESAKLTAALDLIEQLHEEGHKVLFFSQFVSMLKIVREKLEEMNLPYHWLTGASDNRAEIVRGFQEDENASVFLISLKAGGSGLNLTAASYVILYDPWWNPAVESQAIDRAHRIGQTQPVIAYRLLTKGSIEEKILTLQQHKKMLSSDILGEASFAQNLDLNDFEFLLDMERSAAPSSEEDEE
ncbi:MAG: DEAD/DEAH box helicase [Verrucomicrobiaceae bacterium]|nr:DEAD/DEAH box helicase [Verrucomicrobiaceae bacterium]